jgi:phosphate transport system substrate-binding protein
VRLAIAEQEEASLVTRTHLARFALVALALSLTAAACGSDTTTTPGGSASGDLSGLTGDVNVSGSSTVLPISTAVAEKFAQLAPQVSIKVDGPGTGDGFILFCEGKTDISDASRPIEDSEAAACKDAGIHYVELKIGLDGITVMTSPDNGSVTCLTDADLYALFGPESNGFANWADANPLDVEVGGDGALPDAPLTISAPGTESGTYDAFIELVGIEDIALSQGVSEDKAATLRTDYPSSPNDNVIIQGVEGSPSSLGFTGFAYADLQGEGVKKLGVDGGDGCIDPTAETIADGSYPLSRSLYIYVNTDEAASNDALAAYVDYYLSDEGIASVTESDYVAIPSNDLETTRQAWDREISA